jgi:UDP-N-acetylenolpyruvoylglucosamine reductase
MSGSFVHPCNDFSVTNRHKIKNAAENSAADFIAGTSDSALNLVGAEASGTCVNMAGSSVDHSLNALNVGLPGTVGTSVGVRNLDTKGYALTTKITLSHSLHLPSFDNHIVRLSQAL